jgi:hypothetical protein
MLITLFVVAVALSQGQTVASPTPPVRESLQALDAIVARIDPASVPTRVAHERARSALRELLALSVKWPAQSPEDYRRNLAVMVRTLEAAVAQGGASLAVPLGAVAEDLEAKLEHCRKSGGKLGGSVTVRVRTVQGAEEAKSWQVLYLPKILELSETAAPDRFPQLSSPTEEILVPGRYVMWLRHPVTGTMSDRTVVKVGEGRKELLLDLSVPVRPSK